VALGAVIAASGVVLAHPAVGAVVGAAALVAVLGVFVSYRRHVGAVAERDSGT
jgi:hypothetical protein